MPRRPPAEKHFVMRMLDAGDVEVARAELMRCLVVGVGEIVPSAEAASCSRTFFLHLLKRLGMEGEPAKVRERARARFRLPLPDRG